MDMQKHELLEQKMCKELDIIAEKLEGGQEMSISDLEKIDKLYHALKCLATYRAMQEAEVYDDGDWSGIRSRGPEGRRYVSRDMERPRSYYEPRRW